MCVPRRACSDSPVFTRRNQRGAAADGSLSWPESPIMLSRRDTPVGFDPYREKAGPQRFDKVVAFVVLTVVVAVLVWAVFL